VSDLTRREDVLDRFDGTPHVPVQMSYEEAREAIFALPAVTVQAQIDAAREGVLQEAALAVKECLFDENLPLSPHGIELNAVVYECHSAILALIRKGDQP